MTPSTLAPAGVIDVVSFRSEGDTTASVQAGDVPRATTHSLPRLWSRGSVQQRCTATVEAEPGPDKLHQASHQRMGLHHTLLPTVVVYAVSRSRRPAREPARRSRTNYAYNVPSLTFGRVKTYSYIQVPTAGKASPV